MAPNKKSSLKVRKGQGGFTLAKKVFLNRFRQRFYDPEFQCLAKQIEKLGEIAWKNHRDYHKSPRTRPAGPGFADPHFKVPLEWLETRRNIQQAERRQKNPRSSSRVLLICGSTRNDQTCPGEMSKTFRLVKMAQKIFQKMPKFEVDLLDLSHLASEYGRVIYPCKACVSTAMPLCNWPCSCYPNHALGQVNDWMGEIYPRWAAAHGVMIVCPVNWYQAPSSLKLMIDRLVCADGGNPDPSSTQGKNPELAKKLEMKGWSYPRHLAGRAFSIVVHGDAAGVGTLKDLLRNWLTDMDLIEADSPAVLGRYVGYYEPYATSHEALDHDKALHAELRNAARSLAKMIRLLRSGKYTPPRKSLQDPRPK